MLSWLHFYRRSGLRRGKGKKLPGWCSSRMRRTCRIAEHEGSTTLPEVLPHASPDQLPHDWHLELRCPLLVRPGAFELGMA
jgi:hypothetical protein